MDQKVEYGFRLLVSIHHLSGRLRALSHDSREGRYHYEVGQQC